MTLRENVIALKIDLLKQQDICRRKYKWCMSDEAKVLGKGAIEAARAWAIRQAYLNEFYNEIQSILDNSTEA